MDRGTSDPTQQRVKQSFINTRPLKKIRMICSRAHNNIERKNDKTILPSGDAVALILRYTVKRWA